MSLFNELCDEQIAAGKDAIVTPERQRQIAIIELARQDPRLDDELEIDDDPKVSEGDDNGAWVQAWLWVDFSGTPLDKNENTEELSEDREERKINPLYTAYAKSQSMPAEEVLVRDWEQYPGGCMTGFILFVSDMKRKFWEVCPEAFFCKQPGSLVGIEAFHRFVAEQVK